MFYYFKKGKNTTETQKKACVMSGQCAVTQQTCQKQFVKFHAIDFLLDDVQWSDRPVEIDSNQIKKLIENNQCYHMGDSQYTQNMQIKR